MKSIFLSPEQLFENRLALFDNVGTAAPPTDMALLTADDDGFLTDAGGINYYLSGGKWVDRFGRCNPCDECAVRPAIILEPGDEKKLSRLQKDGSVVTVEYGRWPSNILEESMRDMAAGEYERGSLQASGAYITAGSEKLPVMRLGAKEIIRLTVKHCEGSGYLQLSDGTVVTEGDSVFLELRPIRWLYDSVNRMLVSCKALFGGMDRETAERYLEEEFPGEIDAKAEINLPGDAPFRYLEHDELSLIRSYVEADIPVFLHGLSGDGKSDRVKQIDPQVLDIELVNENPETINGRAIYNEAKDEIVDIKPVWLVKLERLCEDGKLHILFFDELTNATKQTQSVIFKIVLERFVNNRWPLPENARIVAAGNDRGESTSAHDLAEPLFGRFAHIYIRTTVENWMPWAVRSSINPYVMEFIANNDLYLRTPYTGTEGNADPRRWEMVSKVLDSSGNDFSLLTPIVGRDAAEAFLRFFEARRELTEMANYSDADIARFSVARRYQIAQQCLCLVSSKPEEARALVKRLGSEYLAWFEYVLQRKAISE